MVRLNVQMVQMRLVNSVKVFGKILIYPKQIFLYFNCSCPSFLFKCKYGACIRKNQVCNGERNCADGSDEQANCPNTLSSGTCKK